MSVPCQLSCICSLDAIWRINTVDLSHFIFELIFSELLSITFVQSLSFISLYILSYLYMQHNFLPYRKAVWNFCFVSGIWSCLTDISVITEQPQWQLEQMFPGLPPTPAQCQKNPSTFKSLKVGCRSTCICLTGFYKTIYNGIPYKISSVKLIKFCLLLSPARPSQFIVIHYFQSYFAFMLGNAIFSYTNRSELCFIVEFSLVDNKIKLKKIFLIKVDSFSIKI